eukprot:EG_transcript_2888
MSMRINSPCPSRPNRAELQREVLLTDLEDRLPVLRAGVSQMREAQAELEAEERAVQLEIESLERRQQRLDQKASEDLAAQLMARCSTPIKSLKEAQYKAKVEKAYSLLEISQLEKEIYVAKRHEMHVAKQIAQRQLLENMRIRMWLTFCFVGNSIPRIASLYRTRDARNILSQLLVPKWQLKSRRNTMRMARALLTKFYLRTMSKPTVEELKNTKLFAKWPPNILHQVRRSMRPVVFRRGEVIVMQGDPGAMMYVIDHGSVDILIHNPNVDGKRRCPGIKVATLSKRGIYFGEFTVLVDEPRMASVKATETTCLWAMHKTTVQFWISKLPAALQTESRELAEDRRRANMYKLFPLTPKFLKEIPMFQMWNQEHCEMLISKCTPAIFNPGKVIIEEGAPGDFMYFLSRGEVNVYTNFGKPNQVLLRTYKPPSLFGEIALLYKEHRSATVVAVKIVECWSLPTGPFHDLMMSVPELFLKAKVIVNGQRANWISALPLRTIMDGPLLPPGFRSVEWARRVQGLMQPRVCDRSFPVTEANCELTELMFCLNGKFGDGTRNFQEGSMLGIEEFIRGQDIWPYTLKAYTRVELWTLKLTAFKSFLKDHEKFGIAWCKSAGDKMMQRMGLKGT